ncbi:MAG: BrnT family toxin [Desulfomonilaceae bacterium]
MKYEWDRDKAEKNLQKHKIDFADAVTALDDEAALTLEDRDSYEERFVTIGMDAVGRILVVVYNWRGERIRLISARKAARSERKQYEGKEP